MKHEIMLIWRPIVCFLVFGLEATLSLAVAQEVRPPNSAKIPPPDNAPEPTATGSVPLVAVLANPSKYDGSRVQTQGVLAIEFEGDALYLTREHRELSIFGNAARLYLRDEGWNINELSPHDGKYVWIEAEVDAAAPGSASIFPLALVDIGAIRLWE